MDEHIAATARFIIDQYNTIGLTAFVPGDGDLGLGLDQLRKLAKRAKFPFLAANLVDASSGKPLFEATLMKKVAGYKVGVFGLTVAGRRALEGDSAWKIEPPLDKAQAAVAKLKADGAQIIVMLSHLSEQQDKEIATKVAGISAILGGGSARMQKDPAQYGESTFAVNGFSKGKHLSILRLNLHRGTKTPGVFVYRDQAKTLQSRLREKELQIARYQRMYDREAAQPGSTQTSPTNRRLKRGAEFYKTHLERLNREKQQLEQEMGQIAAVDHSANFVTYDLLPLGRGIADEPGIAAAVKEFRKTTPELKPQRTKRPASSIGPIRRPTPAGPVDLKRPIARPRAPVKDGAKPKATGPEPAKQPAPAKTP